MPLDDLVVVAVVLKTKGSHSLSDTGHIDTHVVTVAGVVLVDVDDVVEVDDVNVLADVFDVVDVTAVVVVQTSMCYHVKREAVRL